MESGAERKMRDLKKKIGARLADRVAGNSKFPTGFSSYHGLPSFVASMPEGPSGSASANRSFGMKGGRNDQLQAMIKVYGELTKSLVNICLGDHKSTEKDLYRVMMEVKYALLDLERTVGNWRFEDLVDLGPWAEEAPSPTFGFPPPLFPPFLAGYGGPSMGMPPGRRSYPRPRSASVGLPEQADAAEERQAS